GSTDSSFSILGANVSLQVYGLALQTDGKVLVVGGFGSVARVNPDGSEDKTFVRPQTTDLDVYAVISLSDNKALIAGAFQTTLAHHASRLTDTGSKDPSFNVTAALGTVHSIALQPDGKILAGGNKLARLNGDGTLDSE